MRSGAVTATSAMVCDPAHRARLSRFAGELTGRVGIHLQLTDGKPISESSRIPTLVEGGKFPRRREHLHGLDPEEVLLEWRAQLEAMRSLDIQPSHIDTHHSVHALPALSGIYLAFAFETGLPVRGESIALNRWLREQGASCVHGYACPWRGGPVKLDALYRTLRVMAAVTPGDSAIEIGCHPAVVDDELRARSRYADRRADELVVLTSPGIREAIERLGYKLVTPAELMKSQS
jgi:predicted glycoside hydrolase/deacetylase ChbG (UPF0249 family)